MKMRMIWMTGLILIVIALGACSSPTPTAPPPAAPTASAPIVNLPTQVPAPVVKPTTAPAASPVSAATNFTDAFAYCSTIGNQDVPDARYTGPKMPDAIVNGLIQAAKLSPSMPKDQLVQSSFWRCMNNKVYACTVGANLPCQEKADTNKTPSAAINEYCKANPKADFVPAAVTGRATVYEWKCVNGQAQVGRELFKADARGFISDFWYEIAPSAASTSGASMANPASTYCVQNGGKVDMRKDAKGGEVGYCVFADKSECEEWAYMRGECKPGAKPTTAASANMANPASTYCIQNGGKLDIRKTAAGEVGYCVFADKSECEEWAYMRGECKAGAKPTAVTKADNGKTIQVASGGLVLVTLDGNATTGYAWALESGNDKVVKAQGDPKYIPLPAPAGMVGTGGSYEFRFNAVGAGTATLKFIHKQPWVQSDPKAETFSVTVNVK